MASDPPMDPAVSERANYWFTNSKERFDWTGGEEKFDGTLHIRNVASKTAQQSSSGPSWTGVRYMGEWAYVKERGMVPDP